MSEQFIISIGREYGSGGKYIAKKLAEHYGIGYYDRNILASIAGDKHVDPESYYEFDEINHKSFFSRTVRGMSSSHHENIARLQFDFLRDKASKGESFVVVGRCSEHVLRGYKELISVFVIGDKDAKIKYVMNAEGIDYSAAEDMCHMMDSNRKHYHNTYCTVKWGDSRAYDLSINSTPLGFDGTYGHLVKYIDARREALKAKNA